MTRDELPIATIDKTKYFVIDNPDQVELLKSGDHIKYHCKNCGKTILKYYGARNKESTKRMLCQSCSMRNCENRNDPIIVKDPSQFDNFKYGQHFTYTCKKCGKQFNCEFRPQRIGQYKIMMCGPCRVKSNNEIMWNYNGDKDTVLELTSPEDFDTYKIRNDQRIHYVCRKCGKDVNIRFSHGRENKREIGLRRLLCSKCAHEETYLERYDGKYISNLQDPETKEQIKETNIGLYGVDHYSKTEEHLQRLREYSYARTGCEYLFQSDEFKELSKQASLEKYGTEHPMQNKDVQRRKEETCLRLYGSKMYLNSSAYLDACVEKFGTAHPNFNHNYRYGSWGFNALSFSSYWEFCVYLYYTIVEPFHSIIYEPFDLPYVYKDDGSVSYYQLDFLIDGKMVEIKGDHYLDDEGNLFFPYTKQGNGEPIGETELLNRRLEWAGKNKCMKMHNVEVWTSKQCRPIINAVENYFGKDWIESFRVLGDKNDRAIARKITWTCLTL